MIGDKTYTSMGLLAAALALSATPAAAQSVAEAAPNAAPSDPATVVGDIVVTAQKRSQNLQDVANSVAALSSAEIMETGKNGLADMVSAVPSLSMVSQGPGLSTIALRGVTTGGVRNDEPQNKETVGVYIDETPISVNGFNPDLGLYDLSRVEVLRGPQGTLYGSGAMGGAIRIITNKPDLDAFSGSVEGSASHTRHGEANYSAKGMINVPLITDAVALRAVAYHTYQGGYIDNTATGADNQNDATTTGARLQLGAQLTPELRANLTYMHHNLETGSRASQSAPFQRDVRAFDGLTDRINIFNAALDYDLGWASVSSSTSFLKKENTNRTSLEFLIESALGLDSPAPLVDTTEIEDFSQELRIASSGDGRLSYIAGVFYQDRKRDYMQDGTVPGIDAHVGAPSSDFGAPGVDQVFYGFQNIRQKQKAVFGELSYKITPRLTATAGLRYFDFSEEYETFSSGLLNGGVDRHKGDFSEDGITPKFNLSFDATRDNMLYVQASKGFRLGGVNTTVPADLCRADLDTLGLKETPGSFGSDSVWNYEIGSKNQFMDRRLTLNASVYYIDWTDIQTTMSLPSCAFSFRTNAGKARSIGTELEVRFAVTDALDVYGNLGLTDSALTEDVPFTAWKDGDHVPGVAREQISAGARQAFTVFEARDAYARIDYSYTGKMNTRFDTDNAVNREYGDYHLVNLTAGVRLPGRPIEASVFVRNLFDDDGRVLASAAGQVAPESWITVQPRTIGFTIQAYF
ncbi:TonB-dependent receptor [Brevundimonas faecalis]|uniref:TonB-dependent receptor n=1 Tax=Brevundimonas faecalis TaxID=947378 RepID=UPI003606725B